MLDRFEADLLSCESNSGPKEMLSLPLSAPSELGSDGCCMICECLQRAHPISEV